MGTLQQEIVRLDIHTLRYFLAIVREGSVVGAAKSLHLTQPTLSRQINTLEKRLGTQLYTREGRRIKLTDKGRVLYGYAESVVDLVDKAEAELATEESRVSGTVFVGHGETGAMMKVANAFARVSKRYPQVKLELFVGDTADLIDRLETGYLDFIVECEPISRPGFEQYPLAGSDIWGIFMKSKDPLAKLNSIAPKDLEGHSVMCSRQALKSGMIAQWAGASFDHINFNVGFSTSAATAKEVAKSGLSHVLVYRDIMGYSEDEGLCFRPLRPRMESQRALTWKSTRPLSSAARALLDEIRGVTPGGSAGSAASSGSAAPPSAT